MDDETELPRGVALAWGVAANPQRGPKRELSIERITEVAVELADRGGLAGVSMAAVAGDLGVTPMALYRYVSAKNDLTLLMQEQAVSVPPEPAAAQHWRPALEDWSREYVAAHRRHPWLLDLPVEGVPTTPNGLAWFEAALEPLAALPLGAEERVAVVFALTAQARWQAHIDRADAESDPRGLLTNLVTDTEFPHVRAALDAGALGSQGAGAFGFAVGGILDGLELRLERGEAHSPTAAPDPLAAAIDADAKVREAGKRRREVEKQLREARKHEREARKAARERLSR